MENEKHIEILKRILAAQIIQTRTQLMILDLLEKSNPTVKLKERPHFSATAQNLEDNLRDILVEMNLGD